MCTMYEYVMCSYVMCDVCVQVGVKKIILAVNYQPEVMVKFLEVCEKKVSCVCECVIVTLFSCEEPSISCVFYMCWCFKALSRLRDVCDVRILCVVCMNVCIFSHWVLLIACMNSTNNHAPSNAMIQYGIRIIISKETVPLGTGNVTSTLSLICVCVSVCVFVSVSLCLSLCPCLWYMSPSQCLSFL